MKHIKKIIFACALLTTLILAYYFTDNTFYTNKKIVFDYPFSNALFPKEITPPTFIWSSIKTSKYGWRITVNLSHKKYFFSSGVQHNRWTPSVSTWDSIKKSAAGDPIAFVIEPNINKKRLFHDKAIVTIQISDDVVGAPVLYRQIPLPFAFAEQNIEMTSYSLYNVGNVNHVQNVLGHFKVCGNCHSLSQDGKTIGLDFDAVTRDKGGYFVSKIDSQIRLNKSTYISWSKLQQKNTFGLFSKVSNSGRYVVTTVKDRVISKKFNSVQDIAYSQLFFPVNGVLSVYDRNTGLMQELPGANNPEYVQSNAIWTPDDKCLIFARAKALPFDKKDTLRRNFFMDEKIISEYASGTRSMQFELYIIPFNGGKGGIAKPIEGASANGKSNYFPAISPNGKWLVFCQSKSCMMLQKDSRLYIVPATGGKARKMECNFNSMNSWHAWSPNSKWLVFVTKAFSMYSDMVLTHINDNGDCSVPILLTDAKTSGQNAVNYPEFVNRDPNLPLTMNYSYINSMDIKHAILSKDFKTANQLLSDYLEQTQLTTSAEFKEVANFFMTLGKPDQAKKYEKLSIVNAKIQ